MKVHHNTLPRRTLLILAVAAANCLCATTATDPLGAPNAEPTLVEPQFLRSRPDEQPRRLMQLLEVSRTQTNHPASSLAATDTELRELSSSGVSSRRSNGTLVVLCWNLMWTNFNDWSRLLWLSEVITDDMKADVAGLQECMSEDAMQSAMGKKMTKAPGTDQFNCIFFNPNVVTFGNVSGRRYLGDEANDAYSARYVSYAKLFLDGQEFWMFSTHWCVDNQCGGYNAGPRHNHSANVILALREELGASNLPSIIVGDTNSHMMGVVDGFDNDPGIATLVANGFRIAGTGPAFGGIDYAFVSEGHWRVLERVVGPTAPSDHAVFTVEIELVNETEESMLVVGEPWMASTEVNTYSYIGAPEVGGWGGVCTCPDGAVYRVGDNYDSCGSLACVGGVAGPCEQVSYAGQEGMRAVCASALVEEI